MSNTGNPIGNLSAVDQCSVLTAMKTYSFDQLMARGTKAYGNEDPSVFRFVVSQLLNGNSSRPVEHSLAESIYYQEGHKLALAYRLRDMTRFQKEHEILALQPTADPNTIAQATDFELDVKLQCLVNRHHEEEHKCSSTEDGRTESQSYSENEDGSGSEDEGESDDSSSAKVPNNNAPRRDSNGRLIIRTWKPALGRSVEMVF